MSLEHLLSSKIKVTSELSLLLFLININFILNYEFFFTSTSCCVGWLSCPWISFTALLVTGCAFREIIYLTSQIIREPKMFVWGLTKYCLMQKGNFNQSKKILLKTRQDSPVDNKPSPLNCLTAINTIAWVYLLL